MREMEQVAYCYAKKTKYQLEKTSYGMSLRSENEKGIK